MRYVRPGNVNKYRRTWRESLNLALHPRFDLDFDSCEKKGKKKKFERRFGIKISEEFTYTIDVKVLGRRVVKHRERRGDGKKAFFFPPLSLPFIPYPIVLFR